MEAKNKSKRRTIAIIAILALISLALIISLTLYNLQKSEAIKIGLITPLTGDLANYGQGTLNAVQIAIDEINEAGGINGRQIQLIAEDSPCNANSALTSFNKLISVDRADYIIGPMCSSELLAIAPAANSNNILVLSSSATSPDVTNAGDYVFRDVASDDLRAKVFASYIYTDKGVKEISIIYENDDAGVGYEKAFAAEFERLGGKIAASEIYNKDSSDVRTQLTKIKEGGPLNILMISYPSETGLILKQSEELGIDAQFFEGFEIMMDPQVAKIAGDAINGVIYIQGVSPSNGLTEEFKDNYKSAYGVDAPYYAAEAYDAVKLYAQAMVKEPKDVKSGLYEIKNFEGVSGTITFDLNGDVKKPFEIGQVQDMKLVKIKEI